MSTVEKCVTESMGWMNSKMNAQSKLALTQDPVVKVADMIAKIQVCVIRFLRSNHLLPLVRMTSSDSPLENLLASSPGAGGYM